jgi:alpha-D-xyloside xylohydrolase
MNIKPYDAPAGFDWVIRMTGWKAEAGAVRLELDTAWGRRAQARIEAVDAAVYRWTFIPQGAAKPVPTTCIFPRAKRKISLSVQTTPTGIAIIGPRMTVRIESDPWSLRFEDSRGRMVFSENPGDMDGLGRPFVPPLGFIREGRKTAVILQSFRLHPDEHLYGLGEKFTRLDKVGQKIVSWARDALGSTSERSHKNIPFLWSTRGWGLFIDTGARIEWELGTRSTQSLTAKVEDGVWDSYLILGPGPESILRRYTELTGRSPVPPRWSFGLWVSSGGTYRTQAEIENLIDGLAERDVPASVVHIDPWWMEWRRYCDFRWDHQAFPNPDSLIRKLHGHGLRLCLWEHPYVSIESELFEIGRRKAYFVRRPDGEVTIIDYGLSLAPRPDGIVRRASRTDSWNARVAVIDLTNPEAVEWFKDLHRPLLRQGVDVFKTDFGEDIPGDAVFHDGRTGATMHNLYPLFYNRAVSEVTREERGYSLVWSRSGTASSQRFPVCWSGDPAANWDSLAATIRGGLSLGLSGVPFWSNDIGGYRGKPSPELYIRWAQFGLLCSHSRMHGDGPREPWVFGPEALEIVRKFVRLRSRLFPYLYSLAHEAAAAGLPVLRAMPLAFPDDPSVHAHDLQFMLGPWLLVAPIYGEGGRRTVYFPPSRWYDFWTGKPIEGPATRDVLAPLSRIPLFVRAGAILPTMRAANRIPETAPDPLIVEVWPGVSSAFTLREDEGKTKFTLSQQGNRAVLAWTGYRRKNNVQTRFRV